MTHRETWGNSPRRFRRAPAPRHSGTASFVSFVMPSKKHRASAFGVSDRPSAAPLIHGILSVPSTVDGGCYALARLARYWPGFFRLPLRFVVVFCPCRPLLVTVAIWCCPAETP
jgi:hypothetical protein